MDSNTIFLNLVYQALQQTSSLLLVTNHEKEVEETAKFLQFYSNAEVLMLPAWDCTPYDKVSPSLITLSKRVFTLNQLTSATNPIALVLSAPNLLQKVPPKEAIANTVLRLTKGQKNSRNLVMSFLIHNGYTRSTVAEHEGEFAVRGSVIDIVTKESEWGYRLDFFGEDLDAIKLYNPKTQISFSSQDKISLGSMSELVLNEKRIAAFQKNYRKTFGLNKDVPLPDQEGLRSDGLEHYMPLFYENLCTIFDYLPANTIALTPVEINQELKNNWSNIVNNYKSRAYWAEKEESSVLPPEFLYINAQEVISKLNAIQTAQQSYSKEVTTLNLNYNAFRTPKERVAAIKDYCLSKGNKQLIICYKSSYIKTKLSQVLKEEKLKFSPADSLQEVEKVPANCASLTNLPLSYDIETSELIFVSGERILGAEGTSQAHVNRDANKLISELNNISPGELVIHVEHGVGKFEGVETLSVSKVPHDFVKLSYRDGDLLYVPVENLELISKYSNEQEQELDKLGGKSWQQRKSKLRQKIRVAASQLIEIAAQRANAKAPVITPDSEIYGEFCAQFPYVETFDQANAISSVFEDLKSGKPMDRIICGDAGFGKTEVALRAACAAISNSEPYQVAVIVPTTLLARQHTKTFEERFKNFSVSIKQLSKFTSTSESKKTKEALARGEVDIVIGTHALLSESVKFKNLGLVIVDEEQHFGVAQKEKIKKFRSNIHIMTLSATPIPRTLHMSLSGLKELSIIATPPTNRLPVQTHVTPYDSFTIREAILREFNRGGRTFYVTPRIQYLDKLEKSLRSIVPEVKLVQAHGGMSASQLDQIMNDFYDGKYDVLLSTTIVESGLDIPMANTIIIDRADMFGMSQLYQLRGRVGRGAILPYAYLTFPKNKKLNAPARRRLEAIKSLKDIGGGFTIATSDLDIRGYGNLLGEKQSGHIKEVGLELYQKMLRNSLNSLKGEPEPEDWSPELNLGFAVLIPKEYIPDTSLKLEIYRRISELETETEMDNINLELEDRFGPLPESVKNLVYINKARILAKKANIAKVDNGAKAIVLTFKSTKDHETIVNFITKNQKKVKLKDKNKLMIFKDESQETTLETIISTIKSIGIV